MWLSQVVKSCAISDRGDRLSGGAGCGVCAWIEVATKSGYDSESVADPITLSRTIALAR
jgi:hypothetical protein